MKIRKFEELDSTNDYIKREKNIEEYEIIMAKRQTKGKGTRGRKWISEEGGAWFSFYIKKDKALDMNDCPKLSLLTGLAVYETLKNIENFPYKIKWVNDIYVYEKKIAGILLEMEYNNIIVGIGINVNNEKFGEYEDIAISLKKVSKKDYNIENIIQKVVENFKIIYADFLKGNWEIILNKIKENEQK